MPWSKFALLAALVPLALLRAQAAEVPRPATTLEGQSTSLAWSALPRETLLAWGAPVEWNSGPVVLLADGSMIAQPQRGRSATLRDERLVLSNSTLGPLELPLEWVAGVILRLPSDAQQRDRAARDCWLCPDSQRQHDWLRLENGDQVLGTIESWSETDTGRQLTMKTNVGVVPFDVGRVAQLRFDPSLLVKPTTMPGALLGLDDGTLLRVREWENRADRVEFVSALESAPSPPRWSVPRESVVFLQPLGGKVRYLDALPVDGYRHVPYLSLPWSYELDRNVLGTRLRSGGRLYAKGIGMHSAARLTLVLDKPYRRFDAHLAIDDHTAGRGSVTCRVFVDGEQRFASTAVRGGEKPIPVTVDLAGGKLLSLIVDFGDGGDTLDRVNWLDARVIEN